MVYAIRKNKDGKLYSYYNELFKDADAAVRSLNTWIQFEASLLQAQGEANTLYVIRVDEDRLFIEKNTVTSEVMKNINKLIKDKSASQNDLASALSGAARAVMFEYKIECHPEKNFKLPRSKKESYHLITYKEDVMTEENFLKTRYEFKPVNIKVDKSLYESFYTFVINVVKECKIDVKNKYDATKPILLRPNPVVPGRCQIMQGDEILCTAILFPSSVKEIIV